MVAVPAVAIIPEDSFPVTVIVPALITVPLSPCAHIPEELVLFTLIWLLLVATPLPKTVIPVEDVALASKLIIPSFEAPTFDVSLVPPSCVLIPTELSPLMVITPVDLFMVSAATLCIPVLFEEFITIELVLVPLPLVVKIP